MFVGQGNKFELWDAAQWNARRGEWLEQEAQQGDADLAGGLESLSL